MESEKSIKEIVDDIQKLEKPVEKVQASDIQPDDEWMKENKWDEIYAEDNLPDINVGNIKESEDKE